MEPLLRSFSIGFLLRSVFAGTFFVIAYQVAASDSAALSGIATASIFGIALPIALFAGVTLYGLHRALLYPLLEFALNSRRAAAWRRKVPLISEQTLTVLFGIWDMGAETGKEHLERARQAVVWADFTHLQYVSALCIGAGAAVKVLVAPGAGYEAHAPLISLAAIFVAAGLVSDWRLHTVRERMLKGVIVQAGSAA